MLEKGEPLRNAPDVANNPLLRGFTFLSAKPMLVLINNGDEDETLPDWTKGRVNLPFVVVRGKLEMDLAAMTTEEAAEFLEVYNIQESAPGPGYQTFIWDAESNIIFHGGIR